MKRIIHSLPYLLFGISIIIVFRQWFLSPVLTGGDFWYFFPSMYSTVSSFQYGWIPEVGSGLGGIASVYQPSHFIFSLSTFLFGFVFHLSWENIARFGFFFPYLVFATIMPFILFRKVFPKLHGGFALLASFLFLFNTYTLLLTGGGQINLANACVLGLLVLYLLITLRTSLSSSLLSKSVVLGIAIGLVTVWDVRFAYITLIAYFIFLVFSFKKNNFIKDFIFFFGIPGIIAITLNAFWILPVILLHQNPLQQLGAIYSTGGAVRFFSFAKLENALGLLHPNWPENIFGLTHFMQPEFLLLPILAFSSLLFVSSEKKEEKMYIAYFALVGLIGAFLAKGANDPFGGIYLWMFDHIPGFILFRDPSKWYFLVVISYMILIPYVIAKFSMLLEMKIKFGTWISQLCVVLLMVYVIFLVRPAFLGQLGRTFASHTIPQEYKVLEKYLISNNKFGRTLWVPTSQRFGLSSALHPAVSAEDFFQVSSISGVLDVLQKKSTESILQQAAIGYVVVPYDSEKEIFIQDRKYNNALYDQTVQRVSATTWLTKVLGFGNITVFQVKNPKDHFYLLGQGSVSYSTVNPTEYKVELKSVSKGEKLIFSENYNKYWVMQSGNMKQGSQEYSNLFNSFLVPKDGSYTITITYAPQQLVTMGLVVSMCTAVIIALAIFLIVKHPSTF